MGPNVGIHREEDDRTLEVLSAVSMHILDRERATLRFLGIRAHLIA